MNVWTGIVMLAIAAILIAVGRPNQSGEHPRFLRFGAALVLYPPIILAFLVLGIMAIVTSVTAR
jgi:hypothetical protein